MQESRQSVVYIRMRLVKQGLEEEHGLILQLAKKIHKLPSWMNLVRIPILLFFGTKMKKAVLLHESYELVLRGLAFGEVEKIKKGSEYPLKALSRETILDILSDFIEDDPLIGKRRRNRELIAFFTIQHALDLASGELNPLPRNEIDAPVKESFLKWYHNL